MEVLFNIQFLVISLLIVFFHRKFDQIIHRKRSESTAQGLIELWVKIKQCNPLDRDEKMENFESKVQEYLGTESSSQSNIIQFPKKK